MLLLPLALLACRPAGTDYLADVEVRRAEIQRLHVQTIAVFGGGLYGRGELAVEGMDGQEYLAPLEIRGGTAGFGLDLLPVGASGTAVLELPDRRVMGNELFGRYKGLSTSFVTLAGAEVRHMRNEYGVGIDEAAFGIGVGLMVAHDWLTLDPIVRDEGWDDTGSTADTAAMGGVQ